VPERCSKNTQVAADGSSRDFSSTRERKEDEKALQNPE